MKAVANVIAVIILLTITISLAGTAYVFFSGTVGSETSETFMILDVDENRIAVSNTGNKEITEFKTILDGAEVSNTIDGGSIPAGDSGIVMIDSIEAGSHQLVLMSKSMSQKFNWQVYTSVGPSSTTSSTLGGSTTTISTTTTSSTLGGSTTTISTTTTTIGCTLSNPTITPNCGGCCIAGQTVTMTGTLSGDCSQADIFQIDASDSGNNCIIEFSGGDMQGINDGVSIGSADISVSGTWNIPSIPSQCRGLVVNAGYGTLWEGNPGTGTRISQTPSPTGIGSITFCSASTTTTSSTSTTSSSTSTTASSTSTTTTIDTGLIFNIGHETGDFSEYDSTVTDGGDLSVSSAAGLAGTNYGMDIHIDDTADIYGTKVFPQITSSSYRARFYIDTNSLTIPNYNEFTIFYFWHEGSMLTQVRLYYHSSTGYGIRVGTRNDTWPFHYTNRAYVQDGEHYVEFLIEYASSPSSADGRLTLWVDGVLEDQVNNIQLYTMEKPSSIRWGAASGVDSGTSGTFYMDEFVLRDE
jgi:hypothetical protein